MRVPTRKSEQDRLALQDEPDQHLTPQAVERLTRQLKTLQEELPSAKLELQRAQEMGDLSENFGYQEAKRRLRSLNDRIVSIGQRLASAIVIERGTQDDGKIRIGSTVVLASNGRTFTFEILGSQETDPTRGRISYTSPLGKELIGNTTGETVVIDMNSRRIEYVIKEVK